MNAAGRIADAFTGAGENIAGNTQIALNYSQIALDRVAESFIDAGENIADQYQIASDKINNESMMLANKIRSDFIISNSAKVRDKAIQNVTLAMGDIGIGALDKLRIAENGIVAVNEIAVSGINKAQDGYNSTVNVVKTKSNQAIAFVDTKSSLASRIMVEGVKDGVEVTLDGMGEVIALVDNNDPIPSRILNDGIKNIAKDSTKEAITTTGKAIAYTANQYIDAGKIAINTSEKVVVAIAETSVTISDAVSDVTQTGVENAQFYADRTLQNTNVLAWKTREYFRNHSQKIPEPGEYRTQIVRKNDRMVLAALNIDVYTDMGYPYRRTPVVLFSSPKIAVTNDNGSAVFHDVHVGAHTLEIHKKDGDVDVRKFIVEPIAQMHSAAETEIDVMLPVVQVVVRDPLFDESTGGRGIPIYVWVIIILLGAINAEWWWLMYKRKWKDL